MVAIYDIVNHQCPCITGYTLTNVGETCKDSGLVDIGSKEECTGNKELFRRYYPRIDFNKGLTSAEFPKGCFAFLPPSSKFGIYFNKQSSNAISHVPFRALCKSTTGKNLDSTSNKLT